MPNEPLLANYKLLIAYDGTFYHGWQVQPNGLSIQQLIEEKLSLILRQETKIIGSGRTDAGVHALGQVANFKSVLRFDCRKIMASLNGLLPHAVRILELEEVDQSFHAQYSAKGKIYRYHLHLERVMSPFKYHYCWHIRSTFSISHLKMAIPYLLGEHDFTSFANEAHSGVAAYDPVRNMKRIDVIDEEGGIYLEFEANGFLYKMVRNLVGTLVEIGREKRSPEDIQEILMRKNRSEAGVAAPPQGLFLVKVLY
ncbi:MAG: tRNA pseudouridine(38-40) synthase TruA [Parachlamydiaceae bacterium]